MKKNAQPWMKDYCSTSRHLWRGVWFFHFLSILYKEVNTNRKDSVSSIASKAYTKALAPYHPWLLRKLAGAAMMAIRNREGFINALVDEQTKISGKQYTQEMIYQDLQQLGEDCHTLYIALESFCKSNGIDKLP